MLRNQKGITLVALVVTIVVLIILATISVSLAVNGGLIGEAEKAEAWQVNAEAEFEQMETNVTALIQQYVTNAEAK